MLILSLILFVFIYSIFAKFVYKLSIDKWDFDEDSPGTFFTALFWPVSLIVSFSGWIAKKLYNTIYGS